MPSGAELPAAEDIDYSVSIVITITRVVRCMDSTVDTCYRVCLLLSSVGISIAMYL